jgi:hypothetical protein
MPTKTPHTSQQNPQAERAISTFFNAARSALSQAKLDNTFWSYAAADATRKYISLPTTQDGVVSTPHERCFGTKLDTLRLLPFGHHGFTTASSAKHKLDARPYPSRYLQQLNDHHYLVLNALKNTVNKCRIVGKTSLGAVQ